MSKNVKQATDDLSVLTSITPLARHFDYFIIDIFGVIHDGIKPFPNSITCLQNLRDLGIETCLLSNSPKRAQGAIDQMKSMGISDKLFSHVVTSGEATFHALSKRDDEFHKSCSKDCWFIGNDAMLQTVDGLGLNLHDGPENASFILNAIPGTETSEVDRLHDNLKVAASRGLPMICANPDLVVNIGNQQYKCAGTFAQFYEAQGGRVVYHGKPHKPVYDRCWELFGKPAKTSIIAIGDSLHTDIAGANAFGIASAFNLVGIHWEEVQMDQTPNVADIHKIQDVLKRQAHQPSYILDGFNW